MEVVPEPESIETVEVNEEKPENSSTTATIEDEPAAPVIETEPVVQVTEEIIET